MECWHVYIVNLGVFVSTCLPYTLLSKRIDGNCIEAVQPYLCETLSGINSSPSSARMDAVEPLADFQMVHSVQLYKRQAAVIGQQWFVAEE